MPKEIKTAGLTGLGAVGSIVAAPIMRTRSESFCILADTARRERYIREGIFLNGERLDIRFPDRQRPLDLVLFATKSTALEQAMETATPFIGPDTIILSLLNGITSEQVLSDRFGADNVLYAYFLGHTGTREGNAVTHDGVYHVFFGEKNNTSLSENVQAVKRFFDSTGVCYQIPEQMETAIWQKFVLNVGCNQATALLRCTYAHLQNCPRVMALARSLMEEAAAVAAQRGIPGAESMVEEAVRLIHTLTPADKSSMLQDVEAGRATEAEDFAGTIVQMAQQTGLETPMNRAALQILRAMP